MKKKHTAQLAFFSPRVLLALVVCSAAACSVVSGALLAFFRPETPANTPQRTLTFAERVVYQRAIEDVYWRHRIWPSERPDPKPSLDVVMSQAQLEKKVADYLRNSRALEDYWQRPLTAQQLQAEMDRMAKHTRQPQVLREIFHALSDDPAVIAECLARPVLAERMITELNNEDRGTITKAALTTAGKTVSYTLPAIVAPSGTCTDDTWTPTSTTNAPTARSEYTAVWIGSEMIVWGGRGQQGELNTDGKYNPRGKFSPTPTVTPNPYLNTGARYSPNTDSWTDISTTNAPDARYRHTAVWTGNEMIVWGGTTDTANYFNTGGRYNPATDSWVATSTTNAPTGRAFHTAVWTGSEMIVWGGSTAITNFNTGGRYNPSTDSWVATSTTNAPTARELHRAVWTGSEMIVWGGLAGSFNYSNTGGRYNPGTDSWTATATANAPSARIFHTAVWTGSEMIVWGGFFVDTSGHYLNTGG
jgi:hypothetical protein